MKMTLVLDFMGISVIVSKLENPVHVTFTTSQLWGHEIVYAGERPLPTARLEEGIFVLKELALLTIHKETASVLPLHAQLKCGLDEDESHNQQPHLLVLYPSLCELVISRSASMLFLWEEVISK